MEVVPFIVSRYTSIAAVNSTVHHLLQDDVSTLRLPRFFPCPLVHVSRLLPGVWICLRPHSSTSRPIPWAGCPSHLTPAIRLSPSQYQSRLTPGSDWTFNFQNIFHTGWRREGWDNSMRFYEGRFQCPVGLFGCFAEFVWKNNQLPVVSTKKICWAMFSQHLLYSIFYFLFCLDFPSSSFSWDKPWLCSCIEWIMASQHNHCKQHHFENNYHHCDLFWQFFLFSDCNQTLCAAHVCRRDRSLGAKLMRTQLVTNFAFQQFVTQTCCQLGSFVKSSFCIFLHCKTSLNVRMLGYTMILYDIE